MLLRCFHCSWMRDGGRKGADLMLTVCALWKVVMVVVQRVGAACPRTENLNRG